MYHGIEEAGGETAKAAVADRRVGFLALDLIEVAAHVSDRLGDEVADAKVEQVVEACKKAEERMKTYRTDEHGFIYTFVISQGEEEPYTKEYRYE